MSAVDGAAAARRQDDEIFRPPGMTHWEFVMGEAIRAFNEARWRDGAQNLAHAAYIGATKDEDVDPDVALALVREVNGIGWTPGDAA